MLLPRMRINLWVFKRLGFFLCVFLSLCFGRLHSGLSNHRELHGAIFPLLEPIEKDTHRGNILHGIRERCWQQGWVQIWRERAMPTWTISLCRHKVPVPPPQESVCGLTTCFFLELAYSLISLAICQTVIITASTCTT